MEDDRIIARLRALEAGVKIFVWTGECHARLDTHVVVNWDDPSEVFNTAFDLIIGKEPPFRLWVTPEKSRYELVVRFLRNIREDDIHIQ